SKKAGRAPEQAPAARKWPTFSPWPLVCSVVALLFYTFHLRIHALFPGSDPDVLRNVSAIAFFYSTGWLLARAFRALIGRAGRKSGRQKTPKLLTELVSVILFTVAT